MTTKTKKRENISLKRRVNLYIRYTFLAIKICVVLVICALLFLDYFAYTREYFKKYLMDTSADMGFELEHIVVSGNKNLSIEDILCSLNADVGTPIFAIDIEEARRVMLEKTWVRSIMIQRKLPNVININVYERKPTALWQKNKEIFVIDEEGKIIRDAKVEDFTHLLQIVGADANLYATQLMHNLQLYPELASRVVAAVRFGERRWNLHIEDGIIIKMPETEFNQAWEYINSLYQHEKLFNQGYKVLDMRNKEKIYIEKEDDTKQTKIILKK